MKQTRVGFRVFLVVLVMAMNAWTFDWLSQIHTLWAIGWAALILGILGAIAIREDRALTRRAEAEDMLARVTGERRR